MLDSSKVKAVQKYQREVCHTEYAEEKVAMDCEKSHKLPLSIVSVRHLSTGQNGSGYLVSVTVRISDGKDVIYKR